MFIKVSIILFAPFIRTSELLRIQYDVYKIEILNELSPLFHVFIWFMYYVFFNLSPIVLEMILLNLVF